MVTMGINNMYEKLSALIDNELDELERARLLRELRQDEALVEHWSRYHIIGLAMRREQIAATGELPARVARALENETRSDGDAYEPDRRMPAFGGLGRYAIAASIVGVLLVGGLTVMLYDDSRPTAPAAAPQVAVNGDALHWEGADAQSEDALNALLIEHGEFTSASGMNGLTAYSKFVAYDSR